MTIDRRTVLGAAALPLAARAGATLAPPVPDEAYWTGIASQYDVTRAVIQLEHGNWGMMARPVLATYRAMVERVNRDTSFYARREMVGDLLTVQKRLADALGIGTDEIVFTRNATEAMKTLVGSYNRLRPGDAILYADLDYDSMQACCETRATRGGIKAIRIALPEPATHQSLIDAYTAAFDRNPAIRMVLLTHVSHRTGLVLPVREIAALARSRGADAIVDAAHGIGQIDVALPDLGADFVGLNLHKWMGAPLGVGALYIRRGRLADIDRDPAVGVDEPDDIHARIHTGTVDYAAQLTVPAALDFQQAIGGARRERRLRALRDNWVTPLREDARIEILTPDDARLHCGITSFRLRGRTSHDENVALAKRLLDRHRIFTVHRDGVASGSCVRVTPSLASRREDPDRLVAALRQILAEG